MSDSRRASEFCSGAALVGQVFRVSKSGSKVKCGFFVPCLGLFSGYYGDKGIVVLRPCNGLRPVLTGDATTIIKEAYAPVGTAVTWV